MGDEIDRRQVVSAMQARFRFRPFVVCIHPHPFAGPRPANPPNRHCEASRIDGRYANHNCQPAGGPGKETRKPPAVGAHRMRFLNARRVETAALLAALVTSAKSVPTKPLVAPEKLTAPEVGLLNLS